MNWRTCAGCSDVVLEEQASTSTRRIGEADGVEYRCHECSDPWEDGLCEKKVGPVPKLGGETFTCVLPVFHAGDHESTDGTWWVDRSDPVNAPSHYRWLPNGIEVIDITETLNFNMGNVVKYVMRADHKGKSLEDLKKARWYLDRELARREQA